MHVVCIDNIFSIQQRTIDNKCGLQSIYLSWEDLFRCERAADINETVALNSQLHNVKSF